MGRERSLVSGGKGPVGEPRPQTGGLRVCESGGGQVGQIKCSRLLVRVGRNSALPRNPLGYPCHLRQEVEGVGRLLLGAEALPLRGKRQGLKPVMTALMRLLGPSPPAASSHTSIPLCGVDPSCLFSVRPRRFLLEVLHPNSLGRRCSLLASGGFR